MGGRLNNFFRGGKPAEQAGEIISDANDIRQHLVDEIRRLEDAPIGAADVPDTPASASSADEDKKKGKGKGASGRNADDIERQFNDERRSLMAQYNSTLSSMAQSAAERAEYEMRNVEIARLSTEVAIRNNADYSKPQKKQLLAQLEQLAEQERLVVLFQQRRQEEEDAARLDDERFRSQQKQLRLQCDLADSQSERKRIALQIVDAENAHLKNVLENVLVSKTALEADKRRAQLALDALPASAALRREGALRDHESPSQRYLRDLNKSPEQINETIEGIKVDGLEALNDGLAEAMIGVRSLGDVFSNVANQIIADLMRIAIQKNIIGPLANALFGGGGLFGGSSAAPGGPLGLGSLTNGRIPGRATGGPVMAGGTYLVGERGPELLRMGSQGGFVVPNHKLGAGGRSVIQNVTIKVDAQGALLAGQVEQMVQRGMQYTAQLATAAGAAEGERRVMSRSRRRIPG